ncbi:hypothetical protein JD969_14530 [Planctomycetota bacterium]|nr:hypothetical protein JD969_14530 [Planctomycetota bacterium]
MSWLNENWDILRNVIAGTLLHSFWIAGVIAISFAAFLRFTPKNKAELRYRVLLAGLGFIVICILTAGVILFQSHDAKAFANHTDRVQNNAATVAAKNTADSKYTSRPVNSVRSNQSPLRASGQSHSGHTTGTNHAKPINQTSSGQLSPLSNAVNTGVIGNAKVLDQKLKSVIEPAKLDKGWGKQLWTDAAVGVWVIGVLIMLGRGVRGTLGVQRMIRDAKTCDDERWVKTVNELRGVMRIGRRVVVRVSEGVNSPAIVGISSAVLLLPPAMMMGVSAEQMRVIVAHELAHVRRWDYLINLVQMVIEACLFFNPAVWWVSSRIRAEREACCDLAAARLCGGIGDGGEETVAQTLIESARMLLNGPSISPTIQGLDGGDGDGLKERVSRLVRPSHSMSGKVSTKAFIGILLLCGVGLVVASLSMNEAVEVAVKLMTPEERQEKMVALTADHMVSRGEERWNDDEENRASWTLNLVSEDGEEIKSRDVSANVRIKYQGGSIGTGAYSRDVEDQVLRQKYHSGYTTFVVDVSDYAPTWVGPVYSKPNQVMDPIDVVMKRGRTGTLRFVDDHGVVLKGRELRGYYRKPEEYTSSDRLDLYIEEDGTIELQHVPEGEIQLFLDIDWPGYADEEIKVTIADEGVTNVVIPRAKITRGMLLDKETGESISGAKVWVVYRDKKGIDDWRDEGERRYMMSCESDENGMFVFDQFAIGFDYAIVIDAEGYEYRQIEEIHAGQDLGVIELGDEIILSGKITGDLKTLKRNKQDEPVIKLVNKIHIVSESYSHWHDEEVVVEVDEDGVGRFRTPPILQGDVVINAGNARWDEYVVESRDDLVINAGKKLEIPKREVVVTLKQPEGWPMPEGKIRVHVLSPDKGYFNYVDKHQGLIDVVDGKVKFNVPMGRDGNGKFKIEPGELVGYWFYEIFNGTEIKGSTDVYEHEVELKPGGEIYGIINDVNGEPSKSYYVSIMTIEKSKDLENTYPKNYEYVNSACHEGEYGKFRIGPLPLGGTYRVKVSDSRGSSQAKTVSEEFELTEENPIQNIQLQFIEGEDVHALVVDEHGEPMAGVPLSLNGSYKHRNGSGWSYSNPSDKTERDGTFLFRYVNPEVANYRVHVDAFGGYMSKEVDVPFDGKPVVVKLEKGLTFKGNVKVVGSDALAVGAEIRLIAVWNQDDKYRDNPDEIVTNDKGEFEIKGVAPGKYYVYFGNGYDTPDTVYLTGADGGTSSSYTPDRNIITIDADHTEFELQAKKKPQR